MFSPNNRLLMLNGAGLLWLGGSGFNDRERFCITSGAGMICSYFKLIWLQEVNRRIHFNHLAPSLMFLIHRYVNNCSCMATSASMGSNGDGNCSGKRPMVHHDDPPEEVRTASEGGRQPRRLPYPRRRRSPRWPHRPPGGAALCRLILPDPGSKGTADGGGIFQ
ncbi:unnamed protein product, partial [Musa hybrid cultivar]